LAAAAQAFQTGGVYFALMATFTALLALYAAFWLELDSPSTAMVTVLIDLRANDYATKGVANIALVDSDSFWIAGYFEETKLANIHIGDRAEAALIGFHTPVAGHVESIARGISDQNGAADGKGLANINPVFSWVRLAQRIPVRIHIDQVPPDVELAAGMTCTINLAPAGGNPAKRAGLNRRFRPGTLARIV